MFVWLKGKYFKGKMYNDSSEPLTAYGPEYVWKLLYCARIKSQPRSYNCELGGVGVGGGGREDRSKKKVVTRQRKSNKVLVIVGWLRIEWCINKIAGSKQQQKNIE